MTRHMDRRRLLRAGVAATTIAVASPFTEQSAFADYAVAPARRRAASTLAASDPIVVGYSRAVAAMKALPATNPCSWLAQAAIHSPGMGPAGPCNHGAHFWAWHRMYLYWFERIVRHHSGMYDWALPYWDYAWETTASTPTQRQIPAPFRVATSPLYDGTRNAGLNGGGSLTEGATATAGGLSPLSYMTAQSSLNGTPHGAVHVAVGGNMGGFPTAGRDPIFWLHHCQVDRLWNLWLAKGGGRSSPIGDATWRNTSFTFYNECCDPVQMTSCQILRAAQQLSYVYEVEPAQVNQSCPLTLIALLVPELIARVVLTDGLVLENAVQRRPLTARQDRETAARLMSNARSETDTVVLQFKGVEADRHPGAMWEVHVGLPPQARPSARSPHFVGNVAMFGDGIRGEGHHPAEFTFPLNRALRAATDASALEVTLVPTSGVDVGGRPQPPQVRAPVRIGEVNLLLDRGRPAQ